MSRNVKSVLAEVMRNNGMIRPLRRAQLVLLWQRVAGEELSRFTHATGFRDGVLYVSTTDSETAMHLGLQRGRFIEAFHGLGHKQLKDISFRPGRVDPQPIPEPVPPAVPDDEDLAGLQQGLDGLDLQAEVREAARQAAVGIATGRAARRNLGWTPCAVCGELTEHSRLCLTCDRYAGSQRVLSTVRQLVNQPLLETPWLTGGERQVTAWLAQLQLEALMQALMPQVIADQRLRPQLEHLAGNWLGLKLGRDPAQLEDADWRQLPERAARLLGRL